MIQSELTPPAVTAGSAGVVQQLGAAHRRGVRVPLDLGQRDRGAGDRPVGEPDAVARVLPALVRQPVPGPVVPGVLEETVAVDVAELAHPSERRLDVGQERGDVLLGHPPPPGLVGEDDEQRGRVDRAVVAVGQVAAAGERAVPDLVEDLPRLLLADGVLLPPLTPGEDVQRPAREVGVERQRHERGPERVPPEQRQEPRAAGRRVPIAG
ncbi:MAG: hypothetical protein ACO4CZ_18030 [Planctomycetota bacterium]